MLNNPVRSMYPKTGWVGGRSYSKNDPAQEWPRNVYNAWYNFRATICAGRHMGCGERDVIRLLGERIIGQTLVDQVQEDIYE
jgi:hypothetical protein